MISSKYFKISSSLVKNYNHGIRLFSTSNYNSGIHSNKSTFDDIVDFQNTIEIRELPGNVSKNDIKNRFQGLQTSPSSIKMVFDEDHGFAYVTFPNKQDFCKALDMKAFEFAGKNYEIEALKSNQTNWTQRTSYLNRTAVTNHLWKFRGPHEFSAKEVIPPLETKKPSDSYTEIDLFFSSDLSLREMYLSPYGNLRVGRFLEDLDALAATVSYKHAEGGNRKLTLVTASVDRIKLLKPLLPNRDIKMQGMTTYVGKSSMEVMIKVRSKNPENEQWENVLVAYFTMVARDPILHKATPVNLLVPQNEKEVKLFKDGERHKHARMSTSKQSLDVTPPTEEELQIIHSNFMIFNEKIKANTSSDQTLLNNNYLVKSKDRLIEFILMNDTVTKSSILCQPQERNMNGNIFGGYLMRKGFEIAFTTCFTRFNKSLPKFYAMDDITFLLPVNIGDILTLESTIVYTQQIPEKNNCYYVQVEVNAYISKPFENQIKKNLSNVFNFTFFCNENDMARLNQQNSETPLTTNIEKRVLPQTYSEAMRYLTGRRLVERHVSEDNNQTETEIWS
ncbi:hypothetical protein DLAC_11315 [Tieghemostelium lacteum]|uniref:Uncharacterized protein n=1 Tax=Tieghemostelium lacteum TaxID=361077 RepID=A0A151Z3Q4_TIELA|nr:hypothetical protein DLAC_11315 [Tieghemostelium lacteum]|eukprot:KYQ88581.1 hypothetical protein DLAC_11315 [Tieghemostelium lacteum]